MVHHGNNSTLRPDGCTAHCRATVARAEAKLLILCGISGGRVLAQDGIYLTREGFYRALVIDFTLLHSIGSEPGQQTLRVHGRVIPSIVQTTLGSYER